MAQITQREGEKWWENFTPHTKHMPIQLTTDSEQSFREKHRSCLAEFVGTFVLILLGLAAGAQFTLNHPGLDAHMLVWTGWGLALMVALYISAGISV